MATITIIYFSLTALGQLQDGVHICSQACHSRTHEGEATARDSLFLVGCQEPKRSGQRHRGLFKSLPSQFHQWKPDAWAGAQPAGREVFSVHSPQGKSRAGMDNRTSSAPCHCLAGRNIVLAVLRSWEIFSLNWVRGPFRKADGKPRCWGAAVSACHRTDIPSPCFLETREWRCDLGLAKSILPSGILTLEGQWEISHGSGTCIKKPVIVANIQWWGGSGTQGGCPNQMDPWVQPWLFSVVQLLFWA